MKPLEMSTEMAEWAVEALRSSKDDLEREQERGLSDAPRRFDRFRRLIDAAYEDKSEGKVDDDFFARKKSEWERGMYAAHERRGAQPGPIRGCAPRPGHRGMSRKSRARRPDPIRTGTCHGARVAPQQSPILQTGRRTLHRDQPGSPPSGWPQSEKTSGARGGGAPIRLCGVAEQAYSTKWSGKPGQGQTRSTLVIPSSYPSEVATAPPRPRSDPRLR
jgi:hypothetical protein